MTEQLLDNVIGPSPHLALFAYTNSIELGEEIIALAVKWERTLIHS